MSGVVWQMREAHLPHHTTHQANAAGASLIQYVMWYMREAHVPHHILNL